MLPARAREHLAYRLENTTTVLEVEDVSNATLFQANALRKVAESGSSDISVEEKKVCVVMNGLPPCCLAMCVGVLAARRRDVLVCVFVFLAHTTLPLSLSRPR